jgi:chemotaxis methyl-accepting protein methylase
MNPDGFLILGAEESLIGVNSNFKSLCSEGSTVYCKKTKLPR